MEKAKSMQLVKNQKHKLKTIDIKGKSYVTVNERISYFRGNYPNYRLVTEIVEKSENDIIMRALVFNEDDKIVSDGFAHESKSSSYINKTSYIENCQTSAIGRALGNFGIGCDESVASYEEVANAILNQNKSTPRPTQTQQQKSSQIKRKTVLDNKFELESDFDLPPIPEELPSSSDACSYVFQEGKYKGKMIKEIGREQLINYMSDLDNWMLENNRGPKNLLNMIDKIKNYLELQK